MEKPPARKEQRAEDQLGLLMRVARELTADLDLMGVLRRALALSLHAVDADTGQLVLLDEEEQPVMAVLLRDGTFSQASLIVIREMVQEGLEGRVMRQRQPASLPNVCDDPPRPEDRLSESTVARTGAAICVPLLLPRRMVGLLTCTHAQEGFFTQHDTEVLQYIADQAAVAVENAHLFAAEEQRRELADTLGEIARTITATLDLDEVLNLILEQLAHVIPYDSASVFLLHDQFLVIRACRGFEETQHIEHLSFKLDSGQIMARVVDSQDVLVCHDVQQEQDWVHISGLPCTRAWIGAPLIARGEVVGVLTVDSREPGAYTAADARVVAAFADHAAVAVANARLWQQAQRRLQEVAFLYETSQALTASLEIEDVLGSLMDNVCEYFQVEAASVALIDEKSGELVFRVATGAAADEVLGMRLEPGQGIAGWVVASGQPALVPTTRKDERFFEGVDDTTGFYTYGLMAAPIKVGQETIGVIEAINPGPDHLGEEDLKLLMNVAALAASAIQNARHFVRARDAEQRYTSLFEDSADPVVITDASGQIVDANRMLCTILGYEKEFLLGQDMRSFHCDATAMREWLTRALEGEHVLCNVETRAHDGSKIPFEVGATRVFHDGQPYVQWVYHDLRERLQLEQVRQDLTRMIIHDLRNPVSSIMSSIELIRTAIYDKTITIPVDELFTVAQRSGQRLHLLIDSILDLARLEEGKARLDRRSLDVRKLVEEVVEQTRPTSAARELDLESHVPENLPSVYGDRDLLQRVLLNLLSNAVKFTPSGGRIRVEVSQSDEGMLLFQVVDTGMGIPPEYHDHIFNRFARLDHNEVKGTGLGLALCKLAIEAHQGRIWVESEPEKGATFKFLLPVGEPTA